MPTLGVFFFIYIPLLSLKRFKVGGVYFFSRFLEKLILFLKRVGKQSQKMVLEKFSEYDLEKFLKKCWENSWKNLVEKDQVLFWKMFCESLWEMFCESLWAKAGQLAGKMFGKLFSRSFRKKSPKKPSEKLYQNGCQFISEKLVENLVENLR